MQYYLSKLFELNAKYQHLISIYQHSSGKVLGNPQLIISIKLMTGYIEYAQLNSTSVSPQA